MPPLMQPAVTGASHSSVGNFAGTVALAMCALGLTAAVYLTNYRSARNASSGGGSSGGGEGKGESGGGGEVGGHAVGSAAARGGGAAADRAPQRTYYSTRAERHVRRHSSSLVEWADEALGVAIPFSPVLFLVSREERQAPMVLLSLQLLRQPSHHIAIAIEELNAPQSAEAYREASLVKIVDCSRILATTTVRVASTNHPAAEYCYVDERDQMKYVMAVFVTHQRLALTIQYSAHTRVRNLLPTAFYELIRAIRFSPPRPTPSYLLVSEPRLGLGFRLALDFLVHEGLPESTDVGGGGGGAAPPLTHSFLPPSSGGGEGAAWGGAQPHHPLHSGRAGGASRATVGFSGPADSAREALLGGGGAGGVRSIPFTTAAGRGTRAMGLIASYEPYAAAVLQGGAGAAAASASNPLWQQFLERHMQSMVHRLGIRLDAPLRLVFRDAAGTGGGGGSGGGAGGGLSASPPPPEEPTGPGQVVMRPFRFHFSRLGDRASAEDDAFDDDEYGRDGGGGATRPATVVGHCCLLMARLHAHSPCLQLMGEALSGASASAAHSTGNAKAVMAYLCVFYISIGGECVSFALFASAAHHGFEEFVSWCSATIQSVSLGNHLGQSTSVLYCNLRHEVLPFTLAINPGTQTVEEPQLGDPLALVTTHGVERVTVMVRVFPLLQLLPTSSSGSGTPASTSGGQVPRPAHGLGNPTPPFYSSPTAGNPVARAQRERQRHKLQSRVLEHMLRAYLSQLPDAVRVMQWERCSIHGMPAMRFCFEQSRPALSAVGGGDGGQPPLSQGGGVGVPLEDLDACSVATSEWLSSRSLVLEEEVGSLNPFSRYYTPAPPPLAYLGLRPALAPAAGGAPSEGGDAAEARGGFLARGRGAAVGERGRGMHRSLTTSPRPSSPLAARAVEEGMGGEGKAASVGSQPDEDPAEEPLRVGVAVCAEGHAFLFIAPCSPYSVALAQQTVQELASHFAVNSAAKP